MFSNRLPASCLKQCLLEDRSRGGELLTATEAEEEREADSSESGEGYERNLNMLINDRGCAKATGGGVLRRRHTAATTEH